MSCKFRFLIALALFILLFSSHNVLAAVKSYTFRLDTALWDYEGDIGEQWSLVYHQYIDADGNVLTPGDPSGSWEPFLPGPIIRGDVGDIVNVTIQNRIDVSEEHFIEELMDTTIVHWHGIEMGNTYDGTPVSQAPIPSGTDFTYRMELVRPGVFWYHPHWNSMIQNPLGANGAIICDDPISDSLMANKIIPHDDRTFVVTLSDIVFQNDRHDANSGNLVPMEDVSDYDPNDIYIRDVMEAGNSGNFGDVILINGKHLIPFNSAFGNTQQFWHEGLRLETDPVELKEGESVAFAVTNNGMHRFYKIHLAYKTSLSSGWERSPNLFRIGGEGGLLDEARRATGTFDDWKLRAIHSRAALGSLQVPQATSELEEGEFLLPTAARNMVAFQVEEGWVEVALIASGFGVVNPGGIDPTTGDTPTDQEIAVFEVTSGSANPDYVLASPIEVGTDLRTNAVLGTLADPLEDLGGVAAVTSFPSGAADMHGSAILPPSGTIMQDYDITLTGGGPPGINGVTVMFNSGGPLQDTFDNTRYVRLGDVVEWTVETETFAVDHPWHMHGFSFQPIKMELRTGSDGSGAGIYQTLYEWDFVEYLDVIYVPAYHRVTYRFRVEDRNFLDSNNNLYSGGAYGRWLAHCHIFKHAHRGMMMEFMVVDDDNGLTGRRFFTDVYLRDNVGDDGSVPSVGSISRSPDIITRKTTVADGDASFGEGSGTENSNTLGYEVESGQDNYIYVRAKNRGYEDTTDVKTDVYWSEVSTLVTPNFWNFIGTTNPIDVPTGDTLVVADPITWSQADIPHEGHYCFVGITGNTYDPHTLTQADVAGWATGAMTWEGYYDLIRGNNNVAWRNFNVVDVDPDVAAESFGAFRFEFRGAFDRNRRFDLLVVHPFGDKLLWKIPKGTEFEDVLVREIIYKKMPIVSESNEFIVVRVPPDGLIENLKLTQNKAYAAEFVVDTDNPFDVIDREFYVSQIFKFPDGYLGVRDQRPDPVEVGRVTWRFVNRVDGCENDVIDCTGVCGGPAVTDVCGKCRLRGDVNQDGVVNMFDLAILSTDVWWVITDSNTVVARCAECPLLADLDCNGRVDKDDLMILAEDWLLKIYDDCPDICGCRTLPDASCECIRVRKEVTSMTEEERTRYIETWKAAYNDPDGEFRMHIDHHLQLFSRGLHNNGAFLPWHRGFLLKIENYLQEIDCRVTIPYWNWSLEPRIRNSEIWGEDADDFSGDGVVNRCVQTGTFGFLNGFALTNGQCLQRRIGGGMVATEAQVQRLLDWYPRPQQYDMFRNRLEHGPGLHDSVHCLVGGTMCSARSSNDPVFFMHHANIDRIWWQWQQQSDAHRDAYTGVTALDDFMPSGYTPAEMLDMENLPAFGGAVTGSNCKIRVVYEEPGCSSEQPCGAGEICVESSSDTCDPDCPDVCIPELQPVCDNDEDCGPEEWCRIAGEDGSFCVGFQEQDEACNCNEVSTCRDIKDSEALRCGDNLVCSAPNTESPGVCMQPCDENCKGYCTPTGTCREFGECRYDVDCDVESNVYEGKLSPQEGYGLCVYGQCQSECGDPRCVERVGLDFGRCGEVLGWGKLWGECTKIVGCHETVEKLRFELFPNQEECEEGCIDYKGCVDVCTISCNKDESCLKECREDCECKLR